MNNKLEDICFILLLAFTLIFGVKHFLDSKSVKRLKENQEELIYLMQDFVDLADKMSDRIKYLEERVDSQRIEIEALHRELEMEQKLEDTIADIILNDSYPKQDEEYSRKLASLIIEVNREYSIKYGFDEDIPKMLSIIRVESEFNNECVSYAGAKGLMQLMDSTGSSVAKELGFKEYNPFDMEQNIRIAWYYYNKNKDRLGEDKATVAYNQGYRNLTKAVKASRRSNSSYLSKVKKHRQKYFELIVMN